MRTLTSGAATAIALPITSPRYFVEMLFSAPWRITSGASVTWSGNSWTTWDMRVSGFGIDGSQSGQSGTITLGDTDATATAFVNGEGIADRAINIWKYYGEAPGASDPVLLFSGVMDSAEWAADGSAISIKCEQGNASTLYSPRYYLTPDNGFDDLPPPGTIISWNGEQYELKAE